MRNEKFKFSSRLDLLDILAISQCEADSGQWSQSVKNNVLERALGIELTFFKVVPYWRVMETVISKVFKSRYKDANIGMFFKKGKKSPKAPNWLQKFVISLVL